MKLFSMYRKKLPKSSRSVTSHSTYDIASINSLHSLEDTLQAQTPKKSPAEEKKGENREVPMTIEEEPSAGDAQTKSGAGVKGASTKLPETGESAEATEGAPGGSESAESPGTTTSAMTKSQRDDDDDSEFDTSKSTTKRPREKRTDTYEERERKQKEESMMNMWRRTALPKKLPIPTRYPSYLKEPPELSYEETSSSVRRRMYNEARINMREGKFKKGPVSTKQIEPKSNKAVQLRNTYIRKDPVVSQYFSDHYNAYKKPPFKLTNVKFCK